MNGRQKAFGKKRPGQAGLQKFARSSVKPQLSKLYIEPTTRCNLQCTTCIRNSWDESIGSMDMNIYRKLLSDIKEVPMLNSIAFWGIGEPLVHPEIVTMVTLAHETGLETEVITNGHLLDKYMAKELIEAGLNLMVVSVDGTTPSSFMDIRQGGNLLLVEENIRTLNTLKAETSRKNPDVGVEFVMMKSNINQLPNLADRARSLEADFIMLTNLLPCTEEMKDEILYWISATTNDDDERPKWSEELIFPRMDLRTRHLTSLNEFLKKLDRPMPGKLDLPQEYCCPFIEKGSVAITWSGDVSPCVALMHSHRCYILGREKHIRKYSVGNIAEEKLSERWNKNNYQSFRERIFNFDFSPCVQCSGCSDSETNEKDCFGNTHPVCGDCLWARSVLLCP
jgi:MoaA/NifB/PqqE/SkfB family radical SAM enzyme